MGFHRPDVGIEVELLAEGDDWGGVACYSGCGGADGAEECAVAFLSEGVDGFGW